MNLLRAASTISLLTLVSRITGLARETLFAATFGAGGSMDAFNVAFRIPNLLRRLFAEGAFSQAFVPILAATREREGAEATRRLVDAVATVLTWAVVATCVAGVVGAPLLVWAMASGLARFDVAVAMTRWMFPYIGCMALVALSAGVLNTWRRFAVPAATPVLLNLAMIAAAALVAPRVAAAGGDPVVALALGVVAGGLLQLGVQWPALRRIGMLPRIGVSPASLRAAVVHPGVRRVLSKMAPALVGVSVAQLSLVINTQIASHVGVGAVSWLTYADRLMEFPTGLLGVALGAVLLPQLSAALSRDDPAGYSGLLDWGLRLVVLLTVPCAAALLVFSTPLVTVLYHYGRFSAHDIVQTSHAVMGWGVGLLGLVAIKVLAPGFYARQDVRTPVRIAVGVLVCTQVLNALLVPWLSQAGLSLSIGLGACINALLLLAGLRRRGAYRPAPGWRALGAQVAVATGVLAIGLAYAAQRLDWAGLGDQGHRGVRIAWMAACLVAAAGLYFGTLRLCGLDVRRAMRHVAPRDAAAGLAASP